MPPVVRWTFLIFLLVFFLTSFRWCNMQERSKQLIHAAAPDVRGNCPLSAAFYLHYALPSVSFILGVPSWNRSKCVGQELLRIIFARCMRWASRTLTITFLKHYFPPVQPFSIWTVFSFSIFIPTPNNYSWIWMDMVVFERFLEWNFEMFKFPFSVENFKWQVQNWLQNVFIFSSLQHLVQSDI